MIIRAELNGEELRFFSDGGNRKRDSAIPRATRIEYERLTGVLVVGGRRLKITQPPIEGTTSHIMVVYPNGSTIHSDSRSPWRAEGKNTEVLYIGGLDQTPKKNALALPLNYKFRFYFDHKGLPNSHPNARGAMPTTLPIDIYESIQRQNILWNATVRACDEARKACSDMGGGTVGRLADLILESYRHYNGLPHPKGAAKLVLPLFLKELKRAREHEEAYNLDASDIDAVRCSLRKRQKESIDPKSKGYARIHKAVIPMPLVDGGDLLVYLDAQFKQGCDFAPIQKFEKNLRTIVERLRVENSNWLRNRPDGTSKRQVITDSEARSVISKFKSMFSRRDTNSESFAKGWPTIKVLDAVDEWQVSFKHNSSGFKLGRGWVKFGDAVHPFVSGHPRMSDAVASKSPLVPVMLTFPNSGAIHGGVKLHRILPPDAVIKKVSFGFKQGEMYLMLCIDSELHTHQESNKTKVAGFDIGYRTMGEKSDQSFRLGMFGTDTETQDITVAWQPYPRGLRGEGNSQPNPDPFVAYLGPSRKSLSDLGFPVSYPIIEELSQEKDKGTRDIKKYVYPFLSAQVQEGWVEKCGETTLGELLNALRACPAAGTRDWIKRASLHIFSVYPERVTDLVAELTKWQRQNKSLGDKIRSMNRTLTLRKEHEYIRVLHAIGRWLNKRGVDVFAIGNLNLRDSGKKKTKGAGAALEAAQRIKQYLAPGTFIALAKRILPKYGVYVDVVSEDNTSKQCAYDGHLNDMGGRLIYKCGSGLHFDDIDRDKNASSMIRFRSEIRLGLREDYPFNTPGKRCTCPKCLTQSTTEVLLGDQSGTKILALSQVV